MQLLCGKLIGEYRLMTLLHSTERSSNRVMEENRIFLYVSGDTDLPLNPQKYIYSQLTVDCSGYIVHLKLEVSFNVI